jgi:hypothetical protein
MGVRLNVVTLLSSITLFACGGATHGEAKGPETDPWAGYKGTYATAAGASGSPAARVKAAKTEAAQAEAPKEAPVEIADETPAPAPTPTPAAAPAKKAKTGAGKAAPKKKK